MHTDCIYRDWALNGIHSGIEKRYVPDCFTGVSQAIQPKGQPILNVFDFDSPSSVETRTWVGVTVPADVVALNGVR